MEIINSDGKTIGNFNLLFVLIHISPILLYEPTKPLKDRRARISPDLLCVNKEESQHASNHFLIHAPSLGTCLCILAPVLVSMSL